MAEIRPFRALRYDSNRVALKDVLTQPYDKITPAMQDRYYAANPANLIAIEKGRTFPDDSAANNVYTRAAKQVDEWIADEILVQDAAPSIYIYSQEFSVPGTQARRRVHGFRSRPPRGWPRSLARARARRVPARWSWSRGGW